MSNAMRYTELSRLVRQDDDCARIAEVLLGALRELPDTDLALLSDQAERESLFERYWSLFIEPYAERRGAEGASEYDLAHLMGHQGIVVDNIMRLFAAGKPWRERVEALVPLPV